MKHHIASAVTALCIVGIVGCLTSRAVQQDAPGSLVVVQFADPRLRGLRDALRATREVVATLPRTAFEVWRVDANPIGRMATLRGDGRVAFVEAMPGDALAAVPVETADSAQLSAADSAAVAQLTAGAPPGSFRVTTARPRLLTVDLLEAAIARVVAVPLLDSEAPLFTRTGLERIGNAEFSWTGRITDEQSDALLIVRPLGITGTVRYRAVVYGIWPLASGRQVIRRYGTGQVPPDHPPDSPRN